MKQTNEEITSQPISRGMEKVLLAKGEKYGTWRKLITCRVFKRWG